MQRIRTSLLFSFFLLLPAAVMADGPRRSPTLMGPIGLNNMPSARMDPAGTVRIGAGTLDPYLHSFAGAQLTDWLYMGVRQTAEKSALGSGADRFYPGLDLKVTLNKEGRYDPEIALGFLSAFGHKKTASEYFALSKRYNDFDVTLGMGWGRLAGDGHIRNPLRRLSSHFDHNRNFTNEEANSAHDWFTGEDVGFFAGVEYRTPVKGLSLKADWGANPYGVEAKTIPGYDKPADWSLALNYAPTSWMDAMVGMQGTDKIMARLSFQSNLMDWLVRPYKDSIPPALAPRRAGGTPDALRRAARDNDIHIGRIKREGKTVLTAHLYLRPHLPLAHQLGRAARHIANHAPPEIETIHITPLRGKLAGKPIRILRRDLELAALHRKSPEEMWENTEFGGVKERRPRKFPFMPSFSFALENDLSLTEDDSEYLYRSAALARVRAELPRGFFAGVNLKVNIKDNLNRLGGRYPNLDVIRGDVDDYTRRRLYLERAYTGWRKMVYDDVFLSSMAGAIEEMYMGEGMEVLYRPFGKTWAIGAEAWHVHKRQPADIWGIGTLDDIPRFTGHFNLFYEISNTAVTAYAKVGQYLGGDRGATIGISHQFDNGVKLNAFGTATDEADYDHIGGTTHMHGGLTLSIPLGNVPYVPQGSEVMTRFAPLGRNAGQIVDNPEPLYEVTEPVSFRGASRSWHRLLD